jgi:hypothetical protein
MQNRDTGNASSGAIAYPTGYLETIRLVIVVNGKNKALKYRSPVDLTPFETEQGDARYYSELNGAIYVGPPTCAYIHDYYKAFTGLSGSNATNWLITNAPNVYLYGSLLEAALFVGKDPASWYRLFAGALNGLQSSEDDSKRGGALAVTPG